MKKILLTGSSGYLGRNFIQEYSNQYEFEQFSLQESSLNTFSLQGIDTVLHCGALVHQKTVYAYEEYYKVNTLYPFELAKKAKESGVKHFVFISSVAVYGDSYTVVNEDTPAIPVTSYGKSKLEAEKKVQQLSDATFKVAIIRVPMVYGPNAPGNITALIKLIQKIPLLPFAKIQNRRSFIFIGNLFYYFDSIIQKEQEGVFLVADATPLSTTHLIELIADALKREIYLFKLPFFEKLLKKLRPSLYKKLFSSLEIDNKKTLKRVFSNTEAYLPYSSKEGIQMMIQKVKR